MTELMKQREEEKEILKSDMTVTVPAFVVNEYNQLKLENDKLKEQLRWRPVSEKPEKDGWYLCKTRYADNTFGVETVFFNGRNFIYSRVIAWLPIPPALEGEVIC
jgi:regulator of replication initiation timing